jgi:hypothetical protein
MKRFLIFMLLSPLLASITYVVVAWFSGGRVLDHFCDARLVLSWGAKRQH